MKKEKRDLGGLTNIIFDKLNLDSLENIQVLQIPSTFIEGSENVAKSTAFINQWALSMDIDGALSIEKFCKYCNSNRRTFNISDVITLNNFKSYSRHTLKACATGQGLIKRVDNIDYFFVVYRQKSDGRILGCWIPYNEETQKLLLVKTISQEDFAKIQLTKKRKQLEKLQKELGI